MKVKYILFLIIFFNYLIVFSFYSLAQVPVWPPGGNKPAVFSGAGNLPAGRYLPTTKRWNLIWADQIVPNWVTPGKIEFAAKNYIGTQKIFAAQAEHFRNYNPNFLILIYHLAAGLNPAKNSDCPDPKNNSGDDYIGVVAPEGYVSEYTTHFLPWLDKNAIEVNTPKFESMFQHYDTSSYQNRVWHSDPYWLMNINNANWQGYISEITINWMKGNNNEGCFFDVAVETNCSLYNPKNGNPEPRNFDWWGSPHYPAGFSETVKTRQDFAVWMNTGFLAYFKSIYKSFHSNQKDYLVIPNVDQMVTSVYDPYWLDGSDGDETVDGAMIEGFGGYTRSDMWLTLERSFRHLTSRNKIFIAQFYTNSDYERLRRTGMYMLIKNETSYINILGNGDIEWYPEYEIDLGNQKPLPAKFDDLRVAGSGWRSLWKRDYENGMVLCNTSETIMSFSPEGNGWKKITTTGGGGVSDEGIPATQQILLTDIGSSVEIGPGDCVILTKQEPNRVSTKTQNPALVIIPGIISGEEGIKVLCSGYMEIQCFDLSGKRVQTVYTGNVTENQIIYINAEGLISGVYLCRVTVDDKAAIILFRVVR